jgi:gliding motility-associated lipoprotein GldB
MKKHLSIIFVLFSFTIGCNLTSKTEKSISNIHVDFSFIEFHRDFYTADKEELRALKKTYPFLFPISITEKEWLSKIKESEEKLLFQMVDSLYGNLEVEKEKLQKLYQHLKYYIPSFKAPKTFTLINGLDYENAVIYADSLLFISLDMYLGKDAEVYQSFPKYISNNYTAKHIEVDVATKIIQKKFNNKSGRSLLESMIYYGKELYVLKTILPNTPLYIILGFEEVKYNWGIQNEAQIWKYFISEDLLFSTKTSLNKRFIDTAPFSKFYLDSDSESPGKIGTWIGLKIVESYMKNNKTSLDQMTILDAETIFKKSKYKPSK